MKLFTKKELLERIERIGNALPEKASVYMIGGCAMSLRGEKEATKDVDWIVDSAVEMRLLAKTLKAMGFFEAVALPKEYVNLGTAAVLKDNEGFQCDLFLKKVCNALSLSEGMKKRAKLYGEFGNLSVYLISGEDIFLFKGITERERDLEDMLTILRRGLDYKIVLDECAKQRDGSSIWEAFLAEKLSEIEKRYGISLPWKKQLVKIAEDTMMESVILSKMREGKNTVNDLSAALKYSQPVIRSELVKLERKGLVKVDKTGKQFKFKPK
jgi:hypothetical protein